uniref:Uncharacterized protein n=1 Tax=Nymphaea colorata TaxID=210225 RepID=A0A5K1FP56_9MAGN
MPVVPLGEDQSEEALIPTSPKWADRAHYLMSSGSMDF